MKRQLYSILIMLCAATGMAAEPAELVEASGVKGGLVVHLGCGDGTFTAGLRINDRYLVHGLDSDAKNVAKARERIHAKGLYGPVSVDVFNGKSLPYTDNLVNLIVIDDQKVSGVSVQVSGREIERVLAPGGVALLPKGLKSQVVGRSLASGPPGSPGPSRPEGRRWPRDGAALLESPGVFRESEMWTKYTKPWPKEMGEWTHYLQGPGNNPVTPDTRVGPPSRLQWRCEPLWSRSHAFTTSFTAMVTAQGRIFYIMDDAPIGIAQDAVPEQWTLIARDAFNGVLLWKQPLLPWGVAAWKNGALRCSPKVGEECLVAHKDRVMMTLGFQSEVSILDAATGEVLGVCEGTDGFAEMRCEDDILVVNKGGKSLMAFDARNARPLWQVDAQIFNMMINSDRVMYFDRTIKKIVCLRLKDGAPLWESSTVKPKSMLTHGDYVVLGPGLQVLSVETGKLLWSNGKHASRGMFVSQGQIWTMSKNDKHVYGFDLVTGEQRTVIDTEDFYSAGHHPRCHPIKASESYLITANRGSEFISLTGGEHIPNDWVRGACKYGIMPGNGMFYAPPDPCFCFPNQSVKGLNAFAPAPETPLLPMPAEERLQRGPAYGEANGGEIRSKITITSEKNDWPMYRRDPKRSGVTPGEVTPQLAPQWEVELRAPLTPPVSGGGKVVVAAKDEHTVYALDSGSGREVWRYTAGGRIDSPPVIDGPRILFGCADGYAYCLRASDGALVWRFQAAPARRLICDKGQLESPWRVHGSMLLLDGVVYLTAGRSSFLDGGIWIFGLDPVTGEIRYQTQLDTAMTRRDDAKGKPFMPAHHIEGTQSDLLVSQDGSIYLGQFRFDQRLVRQEVPYLMPASQEVSPEVLHDNLKPGREPQPAKTAKKSPLKKYFGISGAYMAMTHPGELERYLDEFGGMTWGEQRPGLHLAATHGFLENDSFNRAFWSYSDIRLGFNMNLFNRDARCGELMVITPERTFLVRGHPIPARTRTFKPGTEGYLLAAMSNPGPTTGEDALVPLQVDKRAFDQKVSENSPIWSHQVPLRIRSMVLAGEALFVAGVPDIANPADRFATLAVLKGDKGAQLQAYSAVDGRKLAEYELTAPPVFDGLIAADGRLYWSTTDGKVMCMAGQQR